MSRRTQTTPAERELAAATKVERQTWANDALRKTREACANANRANPESRQVLRQWSRKHP